MARTMEEKIEIMKAFIEGKDIQVDYGGGFEDTNSPTWDWGLYDYRVNPDEPKNLMTNRQLAELMAKGYGENTIIYWDGTTGRIRTAFEYGALSEEGNSVDDRTRIRPWGSDEWIEPTVDVYEKYISKWNGAFEVDVSKKERTTSEDSSATVSKEETIGVHKRTPQEIADFFNCYVAMDKNGDWYLYEELPYIIPKDFYWGSSRGIGTICLTDNLGLRTLVLAPETYNWRTLYRPHQEPIVKEEEDD